MAEPTAAFDMYYLLVEVLFGNMIASAAGLIFIILVMSFMTRMSPYMWSFIITLFLAVFLSGYFGGIWAALIFAAAFFFMGVSLWLLIQKART